MTLSSPAWPEVGAATVSCMCVTCRCAQAWLAEPLVLQHSLGDGSSSRPWGGANLHFLNLIKNQG